MIWKIKLEQCNNLSTTLIIFEMPVKDISILFSVRIYHQFCIGSLLPRKSIARRYIEQKVSFETHWTMLHNVIQSLPIKRKIVAG